MNQLSLISLEHSRYGIRETTEGVKQMIPELCLVGHVSYHTARPSFFSHHQHAEVLELFTLFEARYRGGWRELPRKCVVMSCV